MNPCNLFPSFTTWENNANAIIKGPTKHQTSAPYQDHTYTLLICLGYSVVVIPTFDSQEPSFMFCFHREFDSKIDNDDAWELFSTYEWFGVLLFAVHSHPLFFGEISEWII